MYSEITVRSNSSETLDLVLPQAVAVALTRPQVALRDRELLLGGVAVEADHLHPVQQRAGDRVRDVRRGDEHHLGQVQLHIQVVVPEGVVLGRVEHLQQRCGGIAPPVRADLVDLVQQDHRVHRAGVAQRPDQTARQRADVGAPVASDLGLVANAAQRHPHELAPGCPGDRLADRGLSGAGRADQGEDRPRLGVGLDPAVLAQLAHGQILGHAVLDVLQAGVVGIQHLARGDRVQLLIGALAPRHRDQPVQVGADHARLAGLLACALQARELLQRLLLDRLWHLCGLDLGAVLLHDRALVLAQLLADRLHLLAQEVVALLLIGALLHILADALSDLQLGQALALQLDRQLQPVGDVERPKQLDLLLVAEVGGVAGRVGQRAGLDDRAQEGRDPAIVAAQLEDLLDDRAVLPFKLARAAVHRRAVGLLCDLDAQLALRACLGSADQGTRDARDRDGTAAAGQPHAV